MVSRGRGADGRAEKGMLSSGRCCLTERSSKRRRRGDHRITTLRLEQRHLAVMERRRKGVLHAAMHVVQDWSALW